MKIDWKRTSRWVGVILLGNCFLFGLNTYINKILHPSCFDSILDSAKNTSSIMGRIGGYRGDHTESSEIEIEAYLDDQPAGFKLKVLGNTGNVTFNGVFQKIDGSCKVIKIDTIFHDNSPDQAGTDLQSRE